MGRHDSHTIPLPLGPMIWSDEFDGTDLDPQKWRYEPSASMVPNLNQEQQRYLDHGGRTAVVRDGVLVITAVREPLWNSTVSARISTYHRFRFTFGVVEARLKVPWKQGFWPAFWMLGANVRELGWPACGEIDIMEVFGHRRGRKACSTVHNEQHSWGTRDPLDGGCVPLGPIDEPQPGWHTWWLYWTPDRIAFYFDSEQKPIWSYARDKNNVSADQFPYTEPMYFIINLAVGGNGPSETVDERALHPPGASLLVDYIRTYNLEPPRSIPEAAPVLQTPPPPAPASLLALPDPPLLPSPPVLQPLPPLVVPLLPPLTASPPPLPPPPSSSPLPMEALSDSALVSLGLQSGWGRAEGLHDCLGLVIVTATVIAGMIIVFIGLGAPTVLLHAALQRNRRSRGVCREGLGERLIGSTDCYS
mmetsp:Transcript_62556/g.104107  ORF Transcript_62556/g.104107 Transcript_62556/m.104107 type:complete len:418 (+) Transcript_62556:311-1564(+)